MDREEIIQKLTEGCLTAVDLENPEVLAVVEEYLQENYPNLDLSVDPGQILLEDPEAQAVIKSLSQGEQA